MFGLFSVLLDPDVWALAGGGVDGTVLALLTGLALALLAPWTGLAGPLLPGSLLIPAITCRIKNPAATSRNNMTTCMGCLPQPSGDFFRQICHSNNSRMFTFVNALCRLYTPTPFFNTLLNINIRQLANTCTTYTSRWIKVYMTNLPSWRNAMESWIA